MNSIQQKLNSRQGASTIIALLLFLICTFAGGAVLVSGYQNVSRTSAIRAEQQRYLAVSSAAQLIKGEIAGKSIALQHIFTTTTDAAGVNNTTEQRMLAQSYTGLLKPLSTEASAIFRSTTPSAGYPISVSLPDYPELEAVVGSVVMGGDSSGYAVTILLSSADGSNQLKLVFPVSIGTTDNTVSNLDPLTGAGTTQRTIETTVTWTRANISLTSISGGGTI